MLKYGYVVPACKYKRVHIFLQGEKHQIRKFLFWRHYYGARVGHLLELLRTN